MDKNKELKDYLRLHYSTQNTNDIAIKFNTTADNIRHIASRLKLKKKCNNDIINNQKLCSTCKKLLPISNFYKDKYQKNKLRYDCIKCFTSVNNTNKNTNNKDSYATTPPTQYCHNDSREGGQFCHNDSIIKTNFCHYRSNKRLDGKRNPIVFRNDIAGLICKECGKWNRLSEYYKNEKMLSGHINICKVCYKERAKSRGV